MKNKIRRKKDLGGKKTKGLSMQNINKIKKKKYEAKKNGK